MNPGDILNVKGWKLTLPTGKPPTEIVDPEKPISPYYAVKDKAVQFFTPCNGTHTPNSKYPRTELRCLKDFHKNTKNSFTYTACVDVLPNVKKDVCVGQIHDSKQKIVEVVVSGSKIFTRDDKSNYPSLDDNYKLGTQFTILLEVEAGHVRVTYNGKFINIIVPPSTDTMWYWKLGCYAQAGSKEPKGSHAVVRVFNMTISN